MEMLSELKKEQEEAKNLSQAAKDRLAAMDDSHSGSSEEESEEEEDGDEIDVNNEIVSTFQRSPNLTFFSFCLNRARENGSSHVARSTA